MVRYCCTAALQQEDWESLPLPLILPFIPHIFSAALLSSSRTQSEEKKEANRDFGHLCSHFYPTSFLRYPQTLSLNHKLYCPWTALALSHLQLLLPAEHRTMSDGILSAAVITVNKQQATPLSLHPNYSPSSFWSLYMFCHSFIENWALIFFLLFYFCSHMSDTVGVGVKFFF